MQNLQNDCNICGWLGVFLMFTEVKPFKKQTFWLFMFLQNLILFLVLKENKVNDLHLWASGYTIWFF